VQFPKLVRNETDIFPRRAEDYEISCSAVNHPGVGTQRLLIHENHQEGSACHTVPQEGFEPPTDRVETGCSIH
jgi:hypothetical protein